MGGVLYPINTPLPLHESETKRIKEPTHQYNNVPTYALQCTYLRAYVPTVMRYVYALTYFFM